MSPSKSPIWKMENFHWLWPERDVTETCLIAGFPEEERELSAREHEQHLDARKESPHHIKKGHCYTVVFPQYDPRQTSTIQNC